MMMMMMSNVGHHNQRRRRRKLTANECARNRVLRLAVKSFPARSWRELDRVGEALVLLGGAGQEKDEEEDKTNIGLAAIVGVDPHRRRRRLSAAEALRIVDTWRVRQSNLPHAIESTALIASILLNHHHRQQQQDHDEQRLLLSIAITRTVNGLADLLQQDRAVATSVVGLCGQLGIPAWIVQLRHEATHQELSPLPTLLLGANALLSYLDRMFWTPIRQRHEQTYRRIMDQLRKYEKHVNDKYRLVATTAAATLPNKRSKNNNNNNNDMGFASRTSRKGSDNLNDDDNDNDDSTSSSEEEEEDNDPFGLTSSRLGSNKNQFALLRYKKERDDDVNNNKMTPKRKRKMVATKLTQMASDIIIVNSKINNNSNNNNSCGSDRDDNNDNAVATPDILFGAVLDFLIGTDGTGVLPTTTTTTTTTGSSSSLPSPYRFLLKVMGQTWPGFLPVLLVHCVTTIIAITTAPPATAITSSSSSSATEEEPKSGTATTTAAQVVASLIATIQFLCSTSFVKLIDDDKKATPRLTKLPGRGATTGGDKNKGHDYAPAGLLISQMKYPLNTLVDMAPPGSSLHRLLIDILDDGTEPRVVPSLCGVVPIDDVTTTATSTTALSTTSPWKRCAQWDPCPLGSLPTDLHY